MPTASFSTVFNAHDPGLQTTDVKSMLLAQYVRALGGARFTTEASLDHFSYNGVYPYAGDTPQAPVVPFRDGFSGLRWTMAE